jgi:hypothetical protein
MNIIHEMIETLKMIDIFVLHDVKERLKINKIITEEEVVEIENEIIERMIRNIGKQYE